MARHRTPAQAPPPQYVHHQTRIRAPGVRRKWVNGKAEYTFIPPKIGSIIILDSDEEDGSKPVILAPKEPDIKREPGIKQESSPNNVGRHRSHQVPSSSSSDFDRPRQSHGGVQSNVSLNGGQLKGSSDDTSSSSSGDSDSDIYTPSTSPSKISSTSPRTRQTAAQEATGKPEPGRLTRERTAAEEVKGPEHTPLDFYIDLAVRPGQSRTVTQSSSQGNSSIQVCSYDTHGWQVTNIMLADEPKSSL